MHKLIIAALFFAVSATAQAQVYRCADATGKQIYSDRPCDAVGAKGGMIQRERSAESIIQERIDAQEATERKYQRRAAEREQQAFDQQMDEARQRQARAAQPAPQRQSDTAACRSAQKELEFVSSIATLSQNDKRMRTNAAISNVNAACGSNTQLMQEPAKPRRRPTITHCDPMHCFDDQGGIFTKVGPDWMTGPNGRECHRTGNMWQCN